MRVFIKSQRKYGELLSFTLGPVPVSGWNEATKQIVQGMQLMPVGILLVEEKFVYAPLSDIIVDTFDGEVSEAGVAETPVEEAEEFPAAMKADSPPVKTTYKEVSQDER